MQYLYIDTSTGQFGLTIRHVRRLMPNVSIPDDIAVAGKFQRYRCVQPPTLQQFQRLLELAPQNGVQRWHIVNLTSEEIQHITETTRKQYNTIRDQLLADCNWAMLPDADLTPDEFDQWKNYRAALRNVNVNEIIAGVTTFPQRPSKAGK